MSLIASDKALRALDVRPSTKKTNYPEPFASLMSGRTKRKLGDHFGLSNFGVNLTVLQPGGVSALRHAHDLQDEFVYVLAGQPTLVLGDRETTMAPGECIGFRKGTGIAHQIANRTDSAVEYLEVGDRSPGDAVTYPDDDIRAELAPDGSWRFTHKDGTQY